MQANLDLYEEGKGNDQIASMSNRNTNLSFSEIQLLAYNSIPGFKDSIC